jgi:hypothetical protein
MRAEVQLIQDGPGGLPLTIKTQRKDIPGPVGLDRAQLKERKRPRRKNTLHCPPAALASPPAGTGSHGGTVRRAPDRRVQLEAQTRRLIDIVAGRPAP